MELTESVIDLDLILHELLRVPASPPSGIVTAVPEEPTGAAESDKADHAKGNATVGCHCGGDALVMWRWR